MSEFMRQVINKIGKRELKLDVCDLNYYSPQVLPKNSASPSEVIFARLAKKVLKDDSKGNEPVSLKIWLDPKNQKMARVDKLNVEGLKYEVKVYRDIISDILVKRYSPNFIAYLGYGNCSMQKVAKALGDEWIRIEEGFNESYKKWNNKMSIDMLMTEKAGGKDNEVTTLYEYAKNFNKLIKNRRIPEESKKKARREYYCIMFQVIFSVGVMGYYRLMHNDLHSGNILVVKYQQPVARIYTIEGRNYMVKTRYVPYIFDWDFAYCKKFGDNPKIEELEECRKLNICNRYHDKFDLYTLFCSLGFKNIGRIYDTDATRIKEENIPIENIEPYIPNIRKFKPIFSLKRGKSIKEQYKMSRKQLDEVFTEDLTNQLFGNRITDVIFTITYSNAMDKWTLMILNGFQCRGTVFSSDMLTAKDLILKTDYFNDMRLPPFFDDIIKNSQEVYTFPK